MNAENRPRYIYEQASWPRFAWDDARLATLLADVRYRQGRLLGRMERLGFAEREAAVLQAITQEVVKSSEIEGEILDRQQVRSSIARRLGIDIGALAPADRHVDGVVEMMLDATQNHAAPLTAERLSGWHAALFPTGYGGITKIVVGRWRDGSSGPMQVVSGPIGREKVHFEAPPSERVAHEMIVFLEWFNVATTIDPVLKAALAHLWFVTVHPFDDGNGRIARAIADLALARSESSTQRFYSMSAQIRLERDDYYAMLEATQKDDLDVTLWLVWFLSCLGRALDGAEAALDLVLRRTRFRENLDGPPLNARQRKVVNLLLGDFEGKLTSTKWAALTKTSPDSALRDINDLVARGILVKNPGGGRKTTYALASAQE